MTKKVQYVGTGHYREITKADWESVGVSDQGGVIWDRDDRGGDDIHSGKKSLANVHEVTDAAWDFLSKKEPKGHYKIVEEPEEVEPLAAGSDAPSASLPPGAVPAGTTTPTTRRS